MEAPGRHAQFIATLTGAGFVIDSSRPLMVKNVEQLPGRREMLFGLASLGFC
jgi:hypothetical protein